MSFSQLLFFFFHDLPIISISWTERSALRALREQLFVHRSDLIAAFQEFDLNNTGIFENLYNIYKHTHVYKELDIALRYRVDMTDS